MKCCCSFIGDNSCVRLTLEGNVGCLKSEMQRYRHSDSHEVSMQLTHVKLLLVVRDICDLLRHWWLQQQRTAPLFSLGASESEAIYILNAEYLLNLVKRSNKDNLFTFPSLEGVV